MNKCVYFLGLLIFSSLTASERPKGIIDKKIEALIQIKGLKSSQKDEVGKYEIIGKHEYLFNGNLAHLGINQTVGRREFTVDSIKIQGYSAEIVGHPTYNPNEINVLVLIDDSTDNKNSILFYQKIKDDYDIYKKYHLQNCFFVHFLKKQDRSSIISLKFTEDQVKQIIKKPFAMRSILVGLGFAGFIAVLVYCIHSKCMALLQRS
ncbi:MAG TPA: hypothetical protein VHX42_01855 [Candidatus Babeliales bacterium]|jgi:hypothetical protein|nr:hypothetical protein [Candidatus Babeliales bacterium]